MSTASTADLLGLLRRYGLLEPARIEELTRKLAGKKLQPHALGKKLIELGWLTPYQINQLLQGRGQELVLGSYVVLDRLGEGGNGQVFRARHQTLKREAALKVLRPELLADQEILARFYREIEVVSQISHPNIVHAYDAGPIGSNLVLAMELIQGTDLDRLVRELGPVSPAEAAEFVRQAATGLQHAHERGLIHRDIKPANLLATVRAANGESSKNTAHRLPARQIKVLDLGLARFQQAPRGSRTSNLTLLGPQSVMQGTPDFMAPEQALDFHSADIRADIYSLGCTLFYLLTGQPPFAGTLAEKLMKHQQSEPPDIQKIRSDIPASLAQVLGKTLAKRPPDRFQTPGELAEALTALMADGTISAGAPATTKAPLPRAKTKPRIANSGVLGRFLKGRPRLTLLAAVLTMGLLVPFGFWGPLAGMFDTSDQAALRRTLEGLNHPLTSEEQVVQRLRKLVRARPAIVGQLREELLAVRAHHPGSPQALQAGMWLTYLPSPLDQLNAQQIPEKKRFAGQPAELVAVLGEPGATYVRVSALAFRPDCKMLAVGGGLTDIALWDFEKGTPQQLAGLKGHKNTVFSLVFTPDGKWLVSGGGNNSTAGDNSIRVWSVNGPEVRQEAVLAGHTNTVEALAISADGQWLASSGHDQSVRLWNLPQRAGRILAPKTSYVKSLAFAPDDKELAVAASYWSQVRLLQVTPPVIGKFVDLKYPETHANRVVFSPDGQTLAASVGMQVVLWDTATRMERIRLKSHAFAIQDLAFLPHGKAITCGEAGDENQSNVNKPDGLVVVWSLQSREPASTWKLPCGGVRRIALASDGRHLAVGGRNNMVYILRLGRPKVEP